MQSTITHTAEISRVLSRSSFHRPAIGMAELEAVVVIVRVTGTVVVEDVKVTLAGLKLQLLFTGRFEHIDGESVAEPVKPFCAANVRVVDPDCPGLATLILVGFAVIVNVGGGGGKEMMSIERADEVDPVKFASPLYCAVMLFCPRGNWVVEKNATGGTTPESTATGEPSGVPLE
jgi:hypothetical protein